MRALILWTVIATLAGTIATCPAVAETPSAMTATATAPPAAAPTGKRIAVVRFGDGSVNHWWGGASWDVGGGLSYLLERELIKGGVYSVYTRKNLDAVLAEKKINENDPQMRATLGNVAGVGAIITGTITQFGFDDRTVQVGGGVIGHIFRNDTLGGLLGGVKTKTAKAVVAIDAQIIDVATGRILATATGKGESKRGSLGFLGGWLNDSRVDVGGIDMSSSNYQNTILGEATRKCVEQLAKELNRDASMIRAVARRLEGKVADVDGDRLELNIGGDQGVRVGDVLTVEHVLREIRDPDNGQVIDVRTQVLGTITITEVRPRVSIGRFNGAGAPAVGDHVRAANAPADDGSAS